MTIDALSRLDTHEALPVDVIREQAGLPPLSEEKTTGGWVPDTLTAERPIVQEEIGSPLFDEVRAEFDLKPDWWWEERFAHITDELREEIETDNLEQLSADITDAAIQVPGVGDDPFVTIHGVNPASVELTEEDLAPHAVAAMPEYEAPLVAGQRYDEATRDWIRVEDERTAVTLHRNGSLTIDGGTLYVPDNVAMSPEMPTRSNIEIVKPQSKWRRFWRDVGDFIKSYR